ncbi:nuclear transport factor 2 family protein [Nocardia sp. NPDC051990]|uniref:ester cyclase n=1 Tax=Nocardia sp. NPDC051990 TaxID=3155285 RepID=UPI0034380172
MTDDPRATAHCMYDAFNTRDYPAAHDIFAPDFYSHPLQATGPQSVIDAWQRLHRAFPDAHVVIERMIAETDCIAVHSTVHCIPGQQPPTMLEMFTVRNGRITELWGLSNLRRHT